MQHRPDLFAATCFGPPLLRHTSGRQSEFHKAVYLQVLRSRRDDDTSLPSSHRAPVWNQEFQLLVMDPHEQVCSRCTDPCLCAEAIPRLS